MRISKLILCFIALLATSVLHAQQEEYEMEVQEEEQRPRLRMDYSKEKRFAFGFQGGINVSTITGFKYDDYVTDSKALVNFAMGLTFEYLMTPKFQVMTGLSYLKKQPDLIRSGDPSEYIPKYSSTWLQIPLHVGYRLKTGAASNLVFHAGPFYAFGINGDIKWTKRGTAEKRADFFSIFHKQDYGLGIGIDANTRNFVISVSYDHGLKNLAKSGFQFPDIEKVITNSKIPKFSTRSLTITFGYKFRYPFRAQD